MRGILLMVGAVLVSVSLTFSQDTSSKPISAFEQQLIDRQKQFLLDEQGKNPAEVERAVADDFQGIGTNGDFYDKGEVVESAEGGMPAGTRTYDFHVVKLSDDSAVVAYNLIVPGSIRAIGTWPTLGRKSAAVATEISPAHSQPVERERSGLGKLRLSVVRKGKPRGTRWCTGETGT